MRKIFAVLIAVCSLPSCVKEVDVFLPDTPALTNSAFKALFQDIQPAAQTFQVSTNQDTTLSSTQGVHLFIPAGAFTTLSGDPVEGVVEVQLSQAFKKGAWVANRVGTTTLHDLFEHLGAVHIEVKRNDVQLKISPAAKLRFDVPRLVGDEQARLFRGVPDQDNRTLWIDINDQTEVVTNEVFDTQSQQWITNWQWETSATGWFACGQYIPAEQATETTFCITLPEGFDETNTATFAVFQHTNSIVELEWSASERQFCSTFIPIGHSVTLLSISAKAQNHYLGYAETTLEGTGIPVPLQPIGTTPAIFAELLDEL